MYKVVKKKFKNWDEYKKGKPLVCLEDEYGGQSVIATDDHCLVLYNGSDDSNFVMVKHWHPEVVWAIRDFLIDNPSFKL